MRTLTGQFATENFPALGNNYRGAQVVYDSPFDRVYLWLYSS